MLKIFWILLNSFSSFGTFGFQKSDFSQYLRCCFRFRKVTVLRVLTLLKSKGNICTLMFTTKVLKNSTFESQSKGKSFYFYIKKDERESQSKATRGESQVEIIRITNRSPAEWKLDPAKSFFFILKYQQKYRYFTPEIFIESFWPGLSNYQIVFSKLSMKFYGKNQIDNVEKSVWLLPNPGQK